MDSNPAKQVNGMHFPQTHRYDVVDEEGLLVDSEVLRELHAKGLLPAAVHYTPGYLAFNVFCRRDRVFTRPRLTTWKKLPKEIISTPIIL